ncbi:MAG: MFS transporter [Deltaproteobacteria bacterium]|nr:MFS transporter [Deltaproteobacteria bacterium]
MRKKVFYGWWIVLATNVICLLGFGTWLYSFGVFFKPMMAEFGWTRAMTSGAASLRSIEGGVAAPVVGWAVDRYGARILIIIGGVISGAAFCLMPLVNSLWSFYLIYGIILSIGMSAMLYLPAFTVIAKWFDRKLSRAMAVLAVGAGLGGLICSPTAAYLINHIGWRFAFLSMGITIWVVVIPLAFVVREDPADMGLRPDGIAPEEDKPEAVQTASASENGTSELFSPNDYTLKEALASSAFWVLSATFFLQSLTHSVVIVHTVPALTDFGVSLEQAGFAIGLLTSVSVVGRLSFGYLGDFIDKRYLFTAAYSFMALGTLVLVKAQDMSMIYVFIAFFGVGFGGTVPLMPAIRAEIFGRTAFGKIQGFMSPVTMLAGGVGPIMAGYLFDVTGSYKISFSLTCAFAFMAAVIILFVRKDKLKNLITD